MPALFLFVKFFAIFKNSYSETEKPEVYLIDKRRNRRYTSAFLFAGQKEANTDSLLFVRSQKGQGEGQLPLRGDVRRRRWAAPTSSRTSCLSAAISASAHPRRRRLSGEEADGRSPVLMERSAISTRAHTFLQFSSLLFCHTLSE